MTPQKIDALIDRVVSSNSRVIFLVDERGKVIEIPAGESFASRQLIAIHGTDRRVMFDMQDYEVRPTREKVRADLAARLDQEEFKPKVKREKDE